MLQHFRADHAVIGGIRDRDRGDVADVIELPVTMVRSAVPGKVLGLIAAMAEQRAVLARTRPRVEDAHARRRRLGDFPDEQVAIVLVEFEYRIE